MPGMGALGTPNAAEFYLYLALDLLIVAGLVWLALSWKLGLSPAKGPKASAVSAPPPRSRIFLRRGLGSLWIVDGLLQAQPAMASQFAKAVIIPAATGQPSWLGHLIRLEARLWQAHPLDLAAATVFIQLGIGVAILAGGDYRLGRLALWFSIGWSLLVWAGAEGLGGALSAGASEISGAPGAALFYAIAAGLLLSPTRYWASAAIPAWIRRGTGGLLLLGALLQALPAEGFWTRSGLSSSFSEMAHMAQPGGLADPILLVSRLALLHPIQFNAALIALMVVLGTGLLSGRAHGLWIGLTLVWLAASWWLGQDLGGLGTGTATDPNSSPLIALLLISSWGGLQSPQSAARANLELSGLRRKLALAGVAALVVGTVPAALGMPIAALELTTQPTAAATVTVAAGGLPVSSHSATRWLAATPEGQRALGRSHPPPSRPVPPAPRPW
ncbi:MAG: hypothetical protein WBA31_10790 [Candidatus Dormiibacterota bacterium]